MRSAILATCLAVLLVLALGAVPATATHVQCGDTITQDTILDSDVVCVGESYGVTGVTIAADGVTLDLGGHVIDAANSYEDPDSNGIATDGPRTGLTIRNGRVSGFSSGVRMSASNSVVERLRLENGSAGVLLDGDDDLVRRTRIFNTGEFGLLVHGVRATAARNVVTGPLTCLGVSGDDVRALRNVLSGCYEAGGVAGYSGAIVTGNRVTRSAYGFSAFGDGAVIAHNDFSGNDGFGLSVADPHAIVDKNVANENVLENYEGRQGTGIEIHVAGALVKRNRANRNGDLGINAVPGTIDGGGNRAHHNGHPAQCVGGSCR
jgi:hypothetical protein